MTRVLETTTYGESLIHNTQYHCYDDSMDNLLKETDYDPDTTDIILYNDGGVFICGNVPLYYLNWDRQKKKRVFYDYCKGCGVCAKVCPFGAIEMKEEGEE